MNKSGGNQDVLVEAYGGFHDLASFRAEVGVDEKEVSDDEAYRIIAESLGEEKKWTDRGAPPRHPAERKEHVDPHRFNQELNQIQNTRNALNNELNQLKNLRSELDAEKNRRLYGDKFIFRSPVTLDDYLAKERVKRELKEELLAEKKEKDRLKNLDRMWNNIDKPKPRAKSKSKPRAKSKSKPRAKSKSKPKKK
jgi:hypothetical protein